jgi:ribonucleoside-diphosphate reductase alpha chain
MFVIKRSGQKVPMRYDSITDRNIELSKDLNIDVAYLSKMVIQSLKNGMTTTEIDELAAETAAYMSSYEPDYDVLSARITVSNHHKSTSSSFFETMKNLYDHINKDTERKSNVINDNFMKFIETHKDIIEQNIDYSKDFNYSYFGFKTLQRLYLLKVDKKIVERPQHMLMRVACAIYSTTNGGGDIKRAIQCYKDMAEGYYTHASPTLFNSGSSRQQLSSCFLLDTDDDLKHIYETNLKCALISKHGGGIGVNITKVRAKGSPIHSTNGVSDGIVPMIQVFNSTAKYCNQSGKRKGSIAMYLEPWHPDVVEFLALRYNQPPEELRARDIFLALWVNDLFMKRVEEDGIWSLFCPSIVPQLAETYGEEFEKIYLQAEQEKKYMKQMKARELFEKITHAQIETGLPYILFKDSINKKNMQENIGLIRSSNLCAEIVEVTNGSSTAVCNLASISLPKYVRYVDGQLDFDHEKLYQITKTIVRNIDNIIDINYYPIDEAKKNNTDYRPMGIGIQGLADVFALFKAPWGSAVADTLNRYIFETIYYAAVEASHELALERGSYSAFEGSPYSKGILQYELWNEKPKSVKWDWKALEEKVKRGMRNSLLIALMPTASSSQILGNNEAFEAFTSNLYSRSTLAGDFIILNKHLARDLKELGLWNRELVNKIIENDGSVQDIDEIPDDLKKVYKTVWEIKQNVIIKYAAMRSPFVDQTQSMNIFFDHPTNKLLSSLHMASWKAGLKTGSYYIRSKPSRNAVKFSILKEKKGKEYVKDGKKMVCTEDICTMCSS